MKKSRYVKKVDERIEKLNSYYSKYGKGVSSNTVKEMIEFELSDIVFEQPSHTRNVLNFVMIGTQLFLLMFSLVMNIVGINVGLNVAFANMIILGFVLANNYISIKEWEISKKRITAINVALNIMQTNAKSETIRELQDKFNINFDGMQNQQGEKDEK